MSGARIVVAGRGGRAAVSGCETHGKVVNVGTTRRITTP
jgi:hypothetical protein